MKKKELTIFHTRNTKKKERNRRRKKKPKMKKKKNMNCGTKNKRINKATSEAEKRVPMWKTEKVGKSYSNS
jgi:hypothetical protein